MKLFHHMNTNEDQAEYSKYSRDNKLASPTTPDRNSRFTRLMGLPYINGEEVWKLCFNILIILMTDW